MMFSAIVVLATLLSLTHASSLRITQEISFGGAFLDIAKNYTTSNAPTTEVKNGNLYASLEASDIGPLATELDLLCAQQGYVESKSQSGNETVTLSYVLSCKVPLEKFSVFEDALVAKFISYPDGYSYTSDSYVQSNGSPDSSIYLAQQKALENLLIRADTISDVMLVFTAWQNVVSQYISFSPPATATFYISLSQQYVDPFISPPFLFAPPVNPPSMMTSVPTASP